MAQIERGSISSACVWRSEVSDVSARQRACAPTDPEWLEGAVVLATQAGLPLVSRPFEAVAERIGATPEAVEACMRSMLERGAIRRIAAVPNHYAIGYTANGMSVWDVPDERIDELTNRLGELRMSIEADRDA